MSDVLDKVRQYVQAMNSPNPPIAATTAAQTQIQGGSLSGLGQSLGQQHTTYQGTTTGISGSAWAPYGGTTTTGGASSINSWPTYLQYNSPPSLPIKLNLRELVKLMRALEADEELKGIIQKFQPFIGVEV